MLVLPRVGPCGVVPVGMELYLNILGLLKVLAAVRELIRMVKLAIWTVAILRVPGKPIQTLILGMGILKSMLTMPTCGEQWLFMVKPLLLLLTAVGLTGVLAVNPAAAARRPVVVQIPHRLTAEQIVPVLIRKIVIPKRALSIVPGLLLKVALQARMLAVKQMVELNPELVTLVMVHGVVGVLARLQLPPTPPVTAMPVIPPTPAGSPTPVQ
jgi:hypothetical protein